MRDGRKANVQLDLPVLRKSVQSFSSGSIFQLLSDLKSFRNGLSNNWFLVYPLVTSATQEPKMLVTLALAPSNLFSEGTGDFKDVWKTTNETLSLGVGISCFFHCMLRSTERSE